ncbi:hypothetical protein ColTof4_14023 [Colletotrichum tofieldiae]|nr:hypothetical protein ColTof3_14658 [Colletotrichum tofieldiae]GKT81600.1 hypothetical protein ColTof4_14023 [Colletotrichum tofieldiae]GKT97575.1 hypothetical protein Ct61P_15425 [Colletotrichum tofieldiae]
MCGLESGDIKHNLTPTDLRFDYLRGIKLAHGPATIKTATGMPPNVAQEDEGGDDDEDEDSTRVPLCLDLRPNQNLALH